MSTLVDRHGAGLEPSRGDGVPQAASARGPGRRLWHAIEPFVVTARPRQWLKNGLVLAAPTAAGMLLKPRIDLLALLAVGSFTLAAIATYFVNDAVDAPADRLHPVKSRRPVAAGLITPRAAVIAGLVCGVGAMAIALSLGWAFTAMVGAYLALTALHSLRLKQVPVLDILVVAGCFLLRAAGGGVATGVQLWNWFLLVALFGSLFLVTAKRAAEQGRDPTGTHARTTLDAYPASWLQQVMTVSLTGTLMGYALWAFRYVGLDIDKPLINASLLPFLAVLLRYSLLVSEGDGEQPERLLTRDRFLIAAAGTWAALVIAGIYLG